LRSTSRSSPLENMSSTGARTGTTNVWKLLLVIDCGTPAKLKGPVQSLEVSYFVHATEDFMKLSEAVSAILSVTSTPVKERLEGHHGNPITRVRYHLTGNEAAMVLDRIATRLTGETKTTLRRNLEELLDEHSALYLRFDKQRLVQGSLQEGSGDAVRVKVKLRGGGSYLARGNAAEFYSKVLFRGEP